jgi:biopolymer transport protein ExbD
MHCESIFVGWKSAIRKNATVGATPKARNRGRRRWPGRWWRHRPQNNGKCACRFPFAPPDKIKTGTRPFTMESKPYMAIPPRRWVGYALLIVGLSLLYDTYTFLRTDRSPLRVPMSVPNELALGYSLETLGIVLLLAPILIRTVDPFAPDASVKMGQGLAHESVERRRARRLPLKKRFSTLPDRGVVGGAVVLLLLIPMFLMVSREDSKGIYVRLTPRPRKGPDENCLAGLIVVEVQSRDGSSKMLLNGIEVSRNELEESLITKLSTRANWEVFVDGDESVSFGDLMYAIDVINSLHAKAVILSPELKRKITEGCRPH